MDENITRWRLILGQDANALGEVSLNEQQSLMDATLAALYREQWQRRRQTLGRFGQLCS